jgi:acetoacetyl-CoA synthetase
MHAVDESLKIDQLPKFFEEAKLNFAENMLSKRGGDIALHIMTEKTLLNPRKITWDQLIGHVGRIADALRCSNFRRGDVVIGWHSTLSPKLQSCL